MLSLKSETKVDKYGQVFFRVSYKDGDNMIEKDISLEDYRRLINESVEEMTTWVNVPKLPPEVYWSQISAKGEEDGYKVVLHAKAQMQPFSYAGKIMRIPFPGLVFRLVVKNGAVIERKVFAVKDEIICPETELYFYPFGNVYTSGDICMGSISINIPTVKDSARFINAFVEGRTNSDLAGAKNTMGYSQPQLLKRIEKETSYPEELLLPFGTKLIDLFN